ncbi:MAG TPA: hypothetical protein VM347_03155, partial [Nonomuraea sp.]|nr:hypothetical protein [Nonomuraea sp.]
MGRIHRGVAWSTLPVGFTAAMVAGAPPAAAELNYEATAEAFAFRMTAANQSLPLGLVIEGQGPLSRARQTSLDQSDALAAFPYPGDSAAQGPGVVGGLIGVPLPAYPLQASTTGGEEPARAQLPGIDLSAESQAALTTARAVVGSGAPGASTLSRIIRTADGGVVSTATTSADGLALGGSATVSGVESMVSVARDGTGRLTRSTDLAIGRISVPGLTMTIPQTLAAPPEPLPLPT